MIQSRSASEAGEAVTHERYPANWPARQRSFVVERGRRSRSTRFLGGLGVRNLDEEQQVTGLWVSDDALLVARQVRIPLHVNVAEDRLPPLGELESVVAVDGGVWTKQVMAHQSVEGLSHRASAAVRRPRAGHTSPRLAARGPLS
jgi:hypothetical protein